jgi:hypothetical protein
VPAATWSKMRSRTRSPRGDRRGRLGLSQAPFGENSTAK